MKKLSLIISLFFSLFMYSQDPTFLWVKSMGGAVTESGVHMATDVYENIYIAGSFEGTVDFDPGAGVTKLSAVGNKDIYLVKLNRRGNFLWAKSMGGAGEDAASSVTVDKFENIYVTGSFEGTVDFDPSYRTYPLISKGGKDIFVQKFTAEGNFSWAINFGGEDNDYGGVIKTDQEGNVYLLQSFSDKVDFDPGRGELQFTSQGDLDICLEKLTPNKTMLWVKCFGGAGLDEGNDLVLDESGNAYITGSFENELDFDPGNNVVIHHSEGYSDVFTEKFYADGSFAWVKCIGSFKGHDVGTSITLDDQGNIYTTGYFEDAIIYNKLNQTDDHKIPMVMVSNGGTDAFIQKLNRDGEIIKLKAFGSDYNDYGKNIITIHNNYLMFTGNFSREFYLNISPPQNQSKTAISYIYNGVFMKKIDDDVEVFWEKEIGNVSNVSTSSMVMDYSGSIIITGQYEGTVDFDPGPRVYSMSSKGVGATFILKLSEYGNPLYLDKNNFIDKVVSYPNPVKDKLTVDLGLKSENVTLTILDIMGNVVKRTENKNASQINLDLNLNPGIYYVNISSENNTVTKKIIVE